MLHKTKHGAYLELVGRPNSWCKPAVASVQWSTSKLCEWKVTRSLPRTALPPQEGWKLHWVSFPRQFSEAGLGWEPSSGWAYRRWVRSLLTLHRTKRSGKSSFSPVSSCHLSCSTSRPRAVCCWSGGKSKLCRASGSEWVIATRGISYCKPSTGAILKCHLSNLARVQMQTGVEFAINSNEMLRFAPNSFRISKQGEYWLRRSIKMEERCNML